MTTWTLDGGRLLDERGDVLAMFPHNLGDARDHANARLACAAPDLLRELTRLVVRCESLGDLVRQP